MNRPYEFHEFPKWLYRVTPATTPVPPVDPRMHNVTTETEHDRTLNVDLVCQGGIVDTAEVEADLQATGWVTHPVTARQAALEAVQREQAAEKARQEAIAAARQEQEHRALEEAVRRALRAEREELTRGRAVRSDEPALMQKAQPLDPLDTAPDVSRLVTLREAADQIGTISKDTLRRMGKRGEARIIRVGGRDMISLTEVARIKATNKIRFR